MRRTLLVVVSSIVAALAASACLAGAAAAATLFGTVSTQAAGQAPTPAAGALVTVREPDSGITVAFTTTDAGGAYALTVPAGTYDVLVEPGLAGGGSPTTIAGVVVDDARRLDVTLVPAVGVVRVSGVIRGPSGPLAGASVSLDGPLGRAASAATASDGSYSLAVAPAEYEMGVRIGGFRTTSPPGLPRVSEMESEPFSLTGDRVVDLTLPASSPVTVRVLDEHDLPIADATVHLPAYELPGGLAAGDGLAFPRVTSGAFGLSTDANGEVQTLMFDGAAPSDGASGSVEPPDGSGYADTAFAPPPVGAGVIVVLQPASTVRLSGVLRGPGGPAHDVGVTLRDSVTGAGATTRTASDGSYVLDVDAGEYELRFAVGFRGVALADLPRIWEAESERFALTADRVVDLTLPTSSLATVRVLGDDDRPVAGADVDLPLHVLPGGLMAGGLAFPDVTSSPLGLTTDAAGEARARFFDGSLPLPGASGLVTPPAGSGYGFASFAPPELGTTVVVRPPRTVRLSGVLRGPGGPAHDVGVTLRDSVTGAGATTRTASDGSYVLDVDAGEYELRFAVGFRGVALADLPRIWEAESERFALTADRVVDLTLPTSSVLTVRVLDDHDRPVAGAEVGVPGYDLIGGLVAADGLTFPDVTSSPLGRETDAAGEMRARIFDGSLPRVGQTPPQVVPPPGSGYLPAAFTPPPMDGDALLVVRFAPFDATPPVVACDLPPSGWHTDEVLVACTASDAVPGLADPADAAFPLSTAVGEGGEDAAAFTGVRQVCDLAGNCATAGPVGPIMIDRAAPQIAFAQSANGANGWWVDGPATVHVTAADLNPRSLSCAVDGRASRAPLVADPGTFEADLVASGSGRHTVSCTASDALGHVAQADEQVLIDLQPPRPPLLAADRPPEHDGGNGDWWADAVTVTATDVGDRDLADGTPGSGVDPASVPGPFVYAAGGVHVTRVAVRDLAGNESAAARLTVRVDADPPRTALTCPRDPVAAGRRATARWSDDDGESGLAGSASGSLALDTSAPGAFAVEHVAADRVGHTATSSCTYEVV